MNWIMRLLNRLSTLELSLVPQELPTIYNACKHLGISVDENVETETIAPGVRTFYGFDRHQQRMIRYKAIDLGNRIIIETY